MSTVGYGDVTFQSDIGRAFSMIVILTGILLLFVLLPYAFIRYFYLPFKEVSVRLRTPRKVPEGTSDHVIICHRDKLAMGIVSRLERERIPYFVIEPDLEEAAKNYLSGLPVIAGKVDNKETYEAMAVVNARLVFANSTDPVNTNIILTVREVTSDVPIAAIAHQENSLDILRLSGATHVLPLNQWLGEQLANRVNTNHAQSHVVGHYKDLCIAEMPVHRTPFANKTIRDTQLRKHTGLSIIAVWERGHMYPAKPDTVLTPLSVPVIVGTDEQLDELNYLLAIYDYNPNPVIVIGGGSVGVAAARALKRKDVPVHLIEKDAALAEGLAHVCHKVIVADAFQPEVLLAAGVNETPSVLLTTTDDAVNIFLAAHCRRINSEVKIVSRITHKRNIEAIHAAGADFVLGSASLGIEATFSILQGKELMVLGEGIDLFSVTIPKSLHRKTLAESRIGAETGLNVIAIQQEGKLITNPPASMKLYPDAELLMMGDADQRQQFTALFPA